MKQLKKHILAFLIVFTALAAAAQMMGPENPAGDPELAGDPPLGAPINGGTIILIAMGFAYAGNKVYHYFSEENKN